MGKQAGLWKWRLESYQRIEELARLPAELQLNYGVIHTA